MWLMKYRSFSKKYKKSSLWLEIGRNCLKYLTQDALKYRKIVDKEEYVKIENTCISKDATIYA